LAAPPPGELARAWVGVVWARTPVAPLECEQIGEQIGWINAGIAGKRPARPETEMEAVAAFPRPAACGTRTRARIKTLKARLAVGVDLATVELLALAVFAQNFIGSVDL
jgi:hypothetical protein